MSSAVIGLAAVPLRTLQVLSSAAIDLAALPFRTLAGPRSGALAGQGTSDSFAHYLERLLTYPDSAKITVRDLLGGLESRAFGLPLAVISAGEIVPVPVPGFTLVISAPLAAIGAQMMVDRQRLWLTESLLNRRLPARQVKRVARAKPSNIACGQNCAEAFAQIFQAAREQIITNRTVVLETD